MFKQVKSALFWYYLYKFRSRVILIVLLLVIALFSNAIYADILEYLKLKDKLQFLELLLISKWLIILFNITFSVYLILTMFKKEEKQEEKKKTFFKAKEQNNQSEIQKEEVKDKEKFTKREKEFLHKRKLRSKADILLEK